MPHFSGMSHLGSSDPCKREKTRNFISNQSSHPYIGNNVERFSSVASDGNLTENVIAKELEDVTRRDKDKYRALSGGTQSSDYHTGEPMNQSSSVSHPAAVPSAASIYPRVALVSQPPRAAGPSSHFENYGLPSHVPTNPPPPSGSHHTPVHTAYRPPYQILTQGQYSNSVGIGMWEKYHPNQWMLSQFDELRIRHREEFRESLERERDR